MKSGKKENKDRKKNRKEKEKKKKQNEKLSFLFINDKRPEKKINEKSIQWEPLQLPIQTQKYIDWQSTGCPSGKYDK